VEASAHLEEAADAAIDLDTPRAGCGDARDELQEGRFPCPIRPDDSNSLSLLDVEGDVLQRVEKVGGLGLLLGLGLRVSEGMVGVELTLHPSTDITEELATVDLTETVDLGDIFYRDGEGHGEKT